MKKFIYKLLIINILSVISYNIALSQTPVTIHTPVGSVVPDVYSFPEMSQADIAAALQYVTTNYPNAEVLAPASRTYNCHTYAWHVTEGGNNVWIGASTSTAEDLYWTDGSYTNTGLQIYPGKVSYSSDNHSAVTTNQTDVFISKWGALPLVRHNKSYCPYNSSTFNYYKISTPSITGNSYYLCNGNQKTFSETKFNSSYIDLNYDWDYTSNAISLEAGGGSNDTYITVEASSTVDEDQISLIVTTPSGIVSSTSVRNIGVNPPAYDGVDMRVRDDYYNEISGSGCWYLAQNTTYEMDVENVVMYGCSISNYDFTLPTGFIEYSQMYNYVRFNTGSAFGGPFSVSATTCCGTRTIYSGYLVVYGGYFLSFSPNPSTGVTIISLTSEDKSEVDPNIEWEFEVFGTMQNLKATVKNIKGSESSIDVSGWNEGIYIVRARIGNKWIDGKLVVEHK